VIALKYFLTLLATGFFSAAVGIVIFDIYAARQLRLLLMRAADDSAISQTPPGYRPFDRVRWKLARQLVTIGCLPGSTLTGISQPARNLLPGLGD